MEMNSCLRILSKHFIHLFVLFDQVRLKFLYIGLELCVIIDILVTHFLHTKHIFVQCLLVFSDVLEIL